MRFMIVCLAAALTGAVLVGPAQARETPQAATQPSARQLEMTRRYIELTMSDQFEGAVRQMVVDQAAMDPTTRDLPEADRQFLAELTAELTTDMIPQMLEAMVPVYARTFTEAELEALLGFFDTESGREILRKTMVSMPEATRAAMTVLPQMMDKMAARLCQHYGCTPDEQREMQDEMRGAVTAPTSQSK